MQKRKNTKIIKLNGRSGRTMNRIEFVIFGGILVYAIAMVIIYFQASSINGYEITMGSLFVSKTYTGLAIRTEEIIPSDYSGYINFFAREGERISTRDKIYSIDESGKLADLIDNKQLESAAYTEQDLKALKQDIILFNRSFDKNDFQSVYDFKYDLTGSILKMSNDIMFKSMEDLNKGSLVGLVNLCNTGKSGYVVFNTDGYENLSLDQLTDDMFDQTKYEKNNIINNQFINIGDPACKIITSEDWSIVIPVDKEREEQFSFDDYMKVKFVKNQNSSWAYVTKYESNGKNYAVLTFNNSCVTFCNDRYVDVELIINDEKGLKIPNTAIVEKDFLVISKDYVTRGGENGNYGVSKEVYDENGKVSYQFVDVNIYSATDEEYYIDGAGIELGDFIRKPETMDGMRITDSRSLIGVYNMNKGFADFKQINILYHNDEYSIISPTTNYGLTVYDRIVLDASSVNTNDFIYYKN